MAAQERFYQRALIRKLNKMFPDCVILKNDTEYIQGIPDLTILYAGNWAMLEVKAKWDSPTQPNQEYYIDMLNMMSFAAFIYPENEEEVLHALQQSLKPRRSTRISQR